MFYLGVKVEGLPMSKEGFSSLDKAVRQGMELLLKDNSRIERLTVYDGYNSLMFTMYKKGEK